jgi:hypothetical protein
MIFFILLSVFLISDASEQVTAPAFITAVRGDTRIVRKQNAQVIPAVLDAGLFMGDSLKTSPGSEATVVYNNGKILSISNGAAIEVSGPPADSATRGGPDAGPGAPGYFDAGAGQAAASALFKFNASGERIALITGVRGPEDSANIVVYAPGNTALVCARPDFAWSRHAAADSYTVVCQRSGIPVWRFTTRDTSMQYPATQEDLVPGSYLLKIVILQDNDTVNAVERFFKVLKPEKIAMVNEALDNIKEQGPDPFTLHFLSAKIYEQEYMILAAIREYEELLMIDPDIAFIHAVLSSLYNKFGLPKNGNLHDDRYKELTGQK